MCVIGKLEQKKCAHWVSAYYEVLLYLCVQLYFVDSFVIYKYKSIPSLWWQNQTLRLIPKDLVCLKLSIHNAAGEISSKLFMYHSIIHQITWWKLSTLFHSWLRGNTVTSNYPVAIAFLKLCVTNRRTPL